MERWKATLSVLFALIVLIVAILALWPEADRRDWICSIRFGNLRLSNYCPTETPTMASLLPQLIVKSENAILWKHPNRLEVVATASAGETYTLKGQYKPPNGYTYYLIELLNGQNVWVNSLFVEIKGNLGQVAFVTPVP